MAKRRTLRSARRKCEPCRIRVCRIGQRKLQRRQGLHLRKTFLFRLFDFAFVERNHFSKEGFRQNPRRFSFFRRRKCGKNGNRKQIGNFFRGGYRRQLFTRHTGMVFTVFPKASFMEILVPGSGRYYRSASVAGF